MQTVRTTTWTLSAAATTLMMAGPVLAQPTYSIDLYGPTSQILDPTPGKVLGIDILTPVGSGMTPPPAVVISDGPGGLGTILETGDRGRELDALSYGTDELFLDNLTTNPNLLGHNWFFSVDEFAVGAPGVAGPSVTTEGAFGFQEASADVYFTSTPTGPVPPGTPGVNTGVFDGNGGLTGFAAPGLNLVEPNPPSTGTTADAGDNLDAFDLDSVPNAPVFFSLDTLFHDPLEAPNNRTNLATAFANGFVGGDVLVTSPGGGGPVLYASATLLGLDNSPISDVDDLDALVLNDDGALHPITGELFYNPFVDLLLFSVRRGSAIIGTPDSLTGTPIEEGDILIPRFGQVPGIFVPAEALGLATLRTDGVAGTFQGFGDDLNALDLQASVIPEPASLMLMATGMMLWLGRKRSQST